MQTLYIQAYDVRGHRLKGRQYGEAKYAIGAAGWRSGRMYRHLAGVEPIAGEPTYTEAHHFRVVNVAGGVVHEFVNPFFILPLRAEKRT